MAPTNDLPPAVDLLVRELAQYTTDLKSFKKRYLSIHPELGRLANWSEYQFPYVSEGTISSGFTITPSLGLDPLSSQGKCAAPSCRLLTAKQIARTVGIYADVAIIPDRISPSLLHQRRVNSDYLEWLLIATRIISELRPLFAEGIFRFNKPGLHLCKIHYREFTSEVDQITEDVFESIRPYLTFSVEGNFLRIADTELHSAPLNFSHKLTPLERQQLIKGVPLETIGRRSYVKTLREEISEAMMSLRKASDVHGVSFSDSRVAMLAARQAEQRNSVIRDVERWEVSRSAVIPWIRELTIEQVVALRREADKALPRFRESIAKALRSKDVNVQVQVIDDLRAEAAEVQAELSALNLPGESAFRALAGSLGLTISVYGFAGEFVAPAVALGSLMTLLGLIHASTRKDHQEHEGLVSKPGYVLVKAKELAEHA